MKKNLLLLLVLALVIGFLSWRDMRPAIGPANPPEDPSRWPYFAAADVPPAAIPDDSLPLTVEQGMFVNGAYVPAGMAPRTFAQRQLSLQFSFKGAIKDRKAVFDKIGEIANAWKDKGCTLIAVYLKDAPADMPQAGVNRFRDTNFVGITERPAHEVKIDPLNPPKERPSDIGLWPRL